jgi:hypothetical protein
MCPTLVSIDVMRTRRVNAQTCGKRRIVRHHRFGDIDLDQDALSGIADLGMDHPSIRHPGAWDEDIKRMRAQRLRLERHQRRSKGD